MKSVLSTLADFISAGLRPRTPLAKAITVALAVKIVVIVSSARAPRSGAGISGALKGIRIPAIGAEPRRLMAPPDRRAAE
jgi:hypothetical protein